MTNYGISIIIPCFNTGDYLKEAIESVIKQPFKCDYEVIIIDDGSTDIKTKKILEDYKDYKYIKVFENSINKGVQFSRNLGIKRAEFDYIMTLDSDDCLNLDSEILKDGTYADLGIQKLEENQDICFVHTISSMFGEYNGFTISAYPVSVDMILNKHHVQTSIIYRREDAIHAGLYNEEVLKWQDWSFAVSILNGRLKNNKKNKISFIDKPFHLYRIHNGPNRISSQNISEREMTKVTIIDNKEIFQSYFPGLTIEEIVEIVVNNKPDKLKDLLYIASNNIHVALRMANEREYNLTSKIEPVNVP